MPCNEVPEAGAPEVCEIGGGALLMPFGGDSEQALPTKLRAAMYLLFLFWCFGGVSIVADVFMSAIEHITSQKIMVYDKAIGKKRTATVWNATVANLTLMALGSSAPEIMLNVIGIFPTFMAGDLGPSTIVGSAAFNLFIIIGVCVVCLPEGEVKKIKDLSVYTITASFSLFAYVWLYVILAVSSPDVVEAWEGIMTFVFFWVLIVIAYMADVGMLPGTTKEESSLKVHPKLSKAEWAEMEMHVRKKHGNALTPQQEAAMIEAEFPAGHSRAVHRVNGSRMLTGGKKLLSLPGSSAAKDKYERLVTMDSSKQKGQGKPQLAFVSEHRSILESAGTVELRVRASAKLSKDVSVKYEIVEGTAKQNDDFRPKDGMSGTVKLGPSIEEGLIKIDVVQSKDVFKGNKDFSVKLVADSQLEAAGACVAKGIGNVVSVTIVDEDRPGVIRFNEEQVEIEGSDKDERLPITILRKEGAAGKVAVRYRTEADSAVEGADFIPTEGKIEFAAGEDMQKIHVDIKAKGKYEGTEMFRVVLSDPEGGITFDKTHDGGSESAICTVVIQGDSVRQYLQVNWDKVHLGTASWKDKLRECLYVGGSYEEQQDATCFDWVMHIIAFPWKLLGACVPPTEYCGGWACFFCALGLVGFVTVLIGDAAELLGCCLQIPPATTAITIVALGTSLPDTFASRTAAKMDTTADNCVGNVTGSNSVNVFLGLGLPWGICSIYWKFFATCEKGDAWHTKFPIQAADHPGGIFVVEAGALGFSVGIFCCCALLCMGTLAVRRSCYGGEIGGPTATGYLTLVFFVLLWLAYIVGSILSEQMMKGTA